MDGRLGRRVCFCFFFFFHTILHLHLHPSLSLSLSLSRSHDVLLFYLQTCQAFGVLLVFFSFVLMVTLLWQWDATAMGGVKASTAMLITNHVFQILQLGAAGIVLGLFTYMMLETARDAAVATNDLPGVSSFFDYESWGWRLWCAVSALVLINSVSTACWMYMENNEEEVVEERLREEALLARHREMELHLQLAGGGGGDAERARARAVGQQYQDQNQSGKDMMGSGTGMEMEIGPELIPPGGNARMGGVQEA